MIFRYLLLLFSISLAFNFISQNESFTKKGVFLRGKVSAFFLIEDAFFRNANIGAEFRLLERHSFGIDYVFFRWRYEQDSLIDGMDAGGGPSSYARRDYLLVDYRFYPFKKLMEEKQIDPYINVFTKIGKVKSWSEDGAYFSTFDKQVYGSKLHFNDFGIAGGLKVDFGLHDRFGIDVNIGAVYRRENRYEEYGYDFTLNEPFTTNLHQESFKFRPHMRLNLYFRVLSFNRK
jgi:hypothetical protein